MKKILLCVISMALAISTFAQNSLKDSLVGNGFETQFNKFDNNPELLKLKVIHDGQIKTLLNEIDALKKQNDSLRLVIPAPQEVQSDNTDTSQLQSEIDNSNQQSSQNQASINADKDKSDFGFVILLVIICFLFLCCCCVEGLL